MKTAAEPLLARLVRTPLGALVAVAVAREDGALVRLDFAREARASRAALERELARRDLDARWSESELRPLERELAAYFAGTLRRFTAPLAPRGTPFQHAVWAELRRIPYGTTISYAELARRIARPTATRAVARANATNPVSILVPCHRVIGSDGTLTGYAGGLERKRALLALEGALHPDETI